MDFKRFFMALAPDERSAFAVRANTSVGYLTQVAYGNKRLELGFADVLSSLSGGLVQLNELPLTENAARQHAIRCERSAHFLASRL
jgi:hypothetical protein